MPHLFLAPLTFVVLLLVLVTAVRGASDVLLIRGGRALLVVMACVAAVGVLATARDWLHMYWACTQSMLAFFSVSGFLLVHIWSADRQLLQVAPAQWNGASLVFLGLLALAASPSLSYFCLGDAYPSSREAVRGMSSFRGLVEVVQYGFGGDIPALLTPENKGQIERGLGHAPHFLTAPMGTSFIAALFWILFATLALVLRAISSGRWRRVLMFLLPFPSAMVVFRQFGPEGLERSIWKNQPWFVRLYGPVLVAALVITIVLFVAIRLDRRMAAARDTGQADSGSEVGSEA